MYSKEWLQNLPIGTIFVMQDDEQYIIYEKKYRLKDKVQRYLKRPYVKEPVRVYYSEQEHLCKLAYPEPNHEFPLEGRLKGIILPQQVLSLAV